MKNLKHLLALFVLLLTATNSFGQQEVLIKRINCGGSTITTNDGLTYTADTSDSDISFTSNSSPKTDLNFVGPELQEPYQSFRYMSRSIGNEFQYNINNLESGVYKVVLHFAEPYHGVVANTSWNTRRFDIDINGEFTEDEFNIMSAAAAEIRSSNPLDGAKKVYMMEAENLNVTNGEIIIKFTKVANDPIVNAIEVFRIDNSSGGGYWSKSGLHAYYNLGNIGIGTSNPDDLLTVNGRIHAKEVKVDLQGALAPDYVFLKDYKLRTLEEVSQHINQFGHLPNIPSAKEMEEEGIELKAMNLKLLEKIEELTLYIIQQNKSQKQLETRIQVLETKE